MTGADDTCVEVVVHLGNVCTQSLNDLRLAVGRHADDKSHNIAAVLAIRARSRVVEYLMECRSGAVTQLRKAQSVIVLTQQGRGL